MLNKIWQERRVSVFLALIILAVCLVPAFLSVPLLKISDAETGEVYVQVQVQTGSKLSFGWTHSLEKIPWDEYYHLDENFALILDTITFPAFGAGIPENKGRVCYVKNGLIFMSEIEEKFSQLFWLNSHTSTRAIILDGKLLARGSDLPPQRKLRLFVERSSIYEYWQGIK
ncbi:MAG: DUF1850 domain-containing protein [Sporomusaceae bacterium]|jgi:hypothetical protein|nr:DUF1850 domain-containing protein [Sporomusaceae bacterium]